MLHTLLICGCADANDPLGDILHSDCQENFGQIQKYIFRKSGQPDIIVATDDPSLLATWTALLTATDGTKVVTTPLIAKPEFGGGEQETFGTGNDVIGGIPLSTGTSATTVDGVLYNAKATVISSLKPLQCPTLEVFMVNERGQMACHSDNPDSPTVISGFPIHSLWIGDKKPGGFNAPDTHAFKFSMPQGWSDNFTIITPTDFNFKDLN